MRRPSSTDALLVIVTGLGWGLLAPATKELFRIDPAAFDGSTIATARAAWCLPLFLVALGVVARLAPIRLDARRWFAVVAAGIAFGPGMSWMYSIAAARTSVAHIAFLVGVSPVVNTAVAALVFRTPLGGRDRLSLVLGVLGIAVLASTRAAAGASPLGDLLMIAWLAVFAAYACLLRVVGGRLGTAATAALVMTVAMGTMLVVGALVGATRGVGAVAASPAAGAWFFGEIVLGSTLVAQTTYAAAVRRSGVAIATIGAEYTALAVGVVWSLAAREPWNALTVVAGLLLAGALAVTFVPDPFARPARAGASPSARG